MASKNVQRAKSARWLQPNVSYDGGGYGDDDYDDWVDDEDGGDYAYNDDDEVPPLPPSVPDIPSIPKEYLIGGDSNDSNIATPHESTENTQTSHSHVQSDTPPAVSQLTHTKSNASSTSQTFVEAGIKKYSLSDGSGPTVEEHQPEGRVLNKVPEAEPEAVSHHPNVVNPPSDVAPSPNVAETSSDRYQSPSPSNIPAALPETWKSQASSTEHLPGSWPSQTPIDLTGSPDPVSSPTPPQTSEFANADSLQYLNRDKSAEDISQTTDSHTYPSTENDTYDSRVESGYDDHEEIYDQYYDDEDKPEENEGNDEKLNELLQSHTPSPLTTLTPPPPPPVPSQLSVPPPPSHSSPTPTDLQLSQNLPAQFNQLPESHDHLSPNVPRQFSQLPSEETHNTAGFFVQPQHKPDEFYGETDSTASLSTGRRSLDSTSVDQRPGRLSMEDRPALHGRQISDSVRNHPVMEDSEEEADLDQINEEMNTMGLQQRPDVQDSDSSDSSDSDSDSDVPIARGVAGRWRPDPIPDLTIGNNGVGSEKDASSHDNDQYADPNQDDLEAEILNSINGNGGSTLDPAIRTPDLNSHSPSRIDDYSPDPELVQLVKNTRFSQHGFPEIRPLNTNKSKDSNESESDDEHDRGHWGESSDDDNENKGTRDVADNRSLNLDEEREANNDGTLHKPSDAGNHLSASSADTDDASSVGTGVSEMEPISPASTNEHALPPLDTIHENSEGRPRQASQAGSIAAKLNKQPTFDFSAALAKPNPADRKVLFDQARLQQIEYSPNLQSWLLSVSSSQHGIGVYTTGNPPKPTQTQAKEEANAQRTVSATFIKPAKTIVSNTISKEAFGKVGEKSTKKAKGLFAMGKKFIGGGSN